THGHLLSGHHPHHEGEAISTHDHLGALRTDDHLGATNHRRHAARLAQDAPASDRTDTATPLGACSRHRSPADPLRTASRGARVIRHVVTLSFRPEATDDQIAAVRSGLDELAATLPTIVSYRHGPDLGLVEGNADWVIVADF